MASVVTIPSSPYWMSRMRVWVSSAEHPDGGFWRQTMRSTKLPHKTTSRRAAKHYADEMERIGRELRDQIPDEVWIRSRLDALIRAAGVKGVQRRTTWEKAAQGFLEAKTAKPRSLESYTKHVAHFANFLGQRTRHDLRSVEPDDISAFYHGLLKRGLSRTSAQQITKTVRSVFHRALHLRQIDANPAALFRMSKDASPSGRKPFSAEDIKGILAAAEPEWRTACLFGLYYGMRIGDATRRRYEEIEGGVLRFLPEKKSRKGVVVSVPLVGELSGLSGKGPITPSLAKLSASVASRQFSVLLDRAGIDRQKTKRKGVGRGITDKTFHSWRHTTNSLLVDAGVDQRVRQLICDHDSTKVSNNYTHASIETMAKALTGLAALTSDQTPPKPPTPKPRQ
jgi:integrase